MWEEGWIGPYRYEAKVYNNPSKYGINGGRVSKLTVIDTDSFLIVCKYDRGWDITPGDSKAIKVVQEILKRYN